MVDVCGHEIAVIRPPPTDRGIAVVAVAVAFNDSYELESSQTEKKKKY